MTIFRKCAVFALSSLICLPLTAGSKKSFFTEVDPDDPNDPWQQSFEVAEKIYEGKTDFQKVVVFRNRDLGRMLVLDNIVQTTETDEFIYHEMLNHIPLLAHANPKRVLVIGGGDGGSFREILRHRSV